MITLVVSVKIYIRPSPLARITYAIQYDTALNTIARIPMVINGRAAIKLSEYKRYTNSLSAETKIIRRGVIIYVTISTSCETTTDDNFGRDAIREIRGKYSIDKAVNTIPVYFISRVYPDWYKPV